MSFDTTAPRDERCFQRIEVTPSWLESNPLEKDTRTPTKPIEWLDVDIDCFAGVKYKLITEISTLRRLGENWFIMLYQGNQYRMADLTAFLALHIKDQDRKTYLVDPEAQGKHEQNKDLDDLTTTAVLQEMEATTGRLEEQQTIDDATGKKAELVLAHGQEDEVLEAADNALLKFEQSAAGTSVATAMGMKWSNVINILRAEGDEVASSFYSFAAAVLCRLIVKEADKLITVFSTSMVERFVQFYGSTDTTLEIPAPRANVLKAIKASLQPKRNLCVGVLKGFLVARWGSAKTPAPEVRGILDYTFLIHASMNGLQLVNLQFQAKHKLGLLKFSELLKQCYCEGTEDSIGLLQAFNVRHFFASTAEEKLIKYALWARLFDDSYYCNLRLSDNSLLAALLIAIIKDDPKDEIWSMPALKISQAEKDYIIAKMSAWKTTKIGSRLKSKTILGTALSTPGYSLPIKAITSSAPPSQISKILGPQIPSPPTSSVAGPSGTRPPPSTYQHKATPRPSPPDSPTLQDQEVKELFDDEDDD